MNTKKKRGKNTHNKQEVHSQMEKIQIEMDEINNKRYELKFLQKLLANETMDISLLTELILFQLAKVDKLFKQND